MGFLNNVAVQWLIRRVPEVAGLVVFISSIIQAIPPEHMATIMAILAGQGGGLTITAVIGLGLWVYAQVISFRKTTQPQVVQKVAGKTVSTPLEEAPVAKERIEQVVPAPRRRTLADILTGR